MPFSHEIVESYDRLKGALVKILESQSPEISIAKQYAQPLLILETPSDLAGFAVVNGEPEPAFFSAYESFKHIYRERHKAWKERNLSFVVCRSDANPERDSFFNVLETDVYFCRKYIVHLYSDQDKLEQDLRRLPFLPLPEGHAGGVTRPPSAQTLLQSLRLGAQLSRQIIVPQEHSAGRIIDELLARREPLPELNLGMDMTLQQQLEPTERSRVKNVSIEGFRAYKKKQEFDLNADVVVLFGPNGLGKTSFFDALDYVCTGRIGRFCRRRISQTDFAAIACHLATTPREARVLMLVDQGDKGYKVERSLDDWSTALINDQEFDRSSTLQLITSSQWGTNRARIENLERLFRATHLFGQSDQEFFTEFEQSSSLSPELVHRMLALDDYASGLAKAAAVLNELDKRIDGRKGEIGSLGQEIQRVQSQIQALPEAVEETTQSDTQLSGIVNRLVADLQSAGVLIEEVKPSKVSVRNWRAMTESALKDAEDRLLRLKRIEAGFAQHVANESTLKSVSGQLSKLLVYTKERTDEHRRQREQRDKLMDRFKKEQSILSECNARLAALRQLTELQEAFRKTNSSLDQWRRVLKSSIEAADAATKELQPLLEAVASQRAKVANLRGVIQTRSHRIAALKVIRGGCSVWEKNCAEINNLQQTADDIRRTIKDYLIRIEQAKNGITNNEKQLAMNERQYRATTADQAKMTQLLDQIEAYVESGVCPVCGVDHKSKPVLIQRIRKQKQDRPAHVEALAKNCNDLRESIKKENATLDGLSANCAAKDKELKRITNKLTETRTSVAVFEQTVSAAGFLLSQQLGLVLDDELAREESILELDQKEVRSAEVQLGDATKRITELEQRLNAQTEAQERASHAITPFEQRSADVVAKVEALGLSLEMTSESLNEECTEVTSKVAVVEERMRRLSSEIDPISRAVDHLQVELTATDTKINDLRQDKKSVEEELLRYEEDAASIVGREGLSVDVISEQRAAASDRVDILEPLRRRCVMLERTIDAVQRSAMLAELEAQSQSLKKRKQALDISLERMSLVRKWFAGVKEVLDRQSSNAVANHVNAFGPLTSLIQKRLRSVYGFGDVNLSSVENEIRVSVGWEDKKLRPVDYFSDSQKQILMLSLFLAGRLTQNWSGFAPILMDDPVTHFDDLNAFGFVELIRGLVSTSPGKRQFFISTCEDRLFDLMIQKFHDVEGGSRFYRFRGAGPDGPIVETVGK